jgi:threonine dehydratase
VAFGNEDGKSARRFTCLIENVSAACGSARVILRVKTRPLPQVVLTCTSITLRYMLTLQNIKEAQARIAERIHRTPVLTSRAFNQAASVEAFFKCENFQRAGSFKIRGATNKIRALLETDKNVKSVVAFSSGNHAQAVALAARDCRLRAVIAMPNDAPRAKVAATRGYGAEIVFYDRLRDDREQVAKEIAERERATLVPPYDDYAVIAGQATCAVELFEDAPELDALLTPCGGGGLFAGASTAAKAFDARIRCFPVEAETANDTWLSLRKGERVSIPPSPTIADGLRPQMPGALTFPVLRQNAEDVLLVSDEEIKTAMRFLLFRMKILAEPSGAVGAAAVLFGKLPRDIKRVGVILSGGNVDAEILTEVVSEKANS